MRTMAFLVAILCLSRCVADDRQDLRNILFENFAACNEEDIDALMETCSANMPNREEFRRESEVLFLEKDIHYSLVDFRVTSLDGDYAEAWVVQATYVDDRDSDSNKRADFRNGTTLLPKDEVVEYMVAFKRDGKRWKCYMTISEPRPYRREKARN